MASLKDKYCIVGVGETEYSRQSGRSTRAMAVEAVGNAMRDAGLGKDGVDGMMSYRAATRCSRTGSRPISGSFTPPSAARMFSSVS